MSATYDLAERLTSPVQTVLAQQERLRATVMQSSGPWATMGRVADIYGTAGRWRRGGGVCEPFGFAKSLDAYHGVASAVQDTLAEHDRLMSSFGASATVAGDADIYAKLGPVAKAGWMPDTAGVAEPWQYRGGVASAVQDTLAEHDRLMSSFGPSATMTKAADIYATAGLVAKGSVMGEPFGLPKSLDAHNVAADIMRVQEELDERPRMQDKLGSFGLSATVAGAVDVHGKFGTVAKTGWMPDTSGVAKAWQSQTGIGSAVQDKVHELERMHDRVMRDFGSPASVAGAADMYGISGPLAAKGSLARGGFGLATSFDEAIAVQKRMDHSWTHYGAAAMATDAGMHKTPRMTATIAGYGSAAGGVDHLGRFASGLVGAGLLAKLDETIAGMHNGSMDLSSLMTATGGIAGMRAATAGFSSVMKGVDPFTGLPVPMGIDGYPSTGGLAGASAPELLTKGRPATDVPRGTTAEPTLIIPDQSNAPFSGGRLWLPSISERRVGFAALWALRELVAYVDLEAGVAPPGHVMQLVSLLWAVAFAWSEFLERKSPGC